jgi:hypothetical protein
MEQSALRTAVHVYAGQYTEAPGVRGRLDILTYTSGFGMADTR